MAAQELDIPRFSADEPRIALAQLDYIFRMGNQKHGLYDWMKRPASDYVIKAERHQLLSKLKHYVDEESGCLHVVHAAADLLLYAELEGKNLHERGVDIPFIRLRTR